jgi:hypothetical protein
MVTRVTRLMIKKILMLESMQDVGDATLFSLYALCCTASRLRQRSFRNIEGCVA